MGQEDILYYNRHKRVKSVGDAIKFKGTIPRLTLYIQFYTNHSFLDRDCTWFINFVISL